MHLCFDILSWIFPLFVPAPSLLLSLMFCWFEGVIAFTSWVHMRQEESEWPVWLCVWYFYAVPSRCGDQTRLLNASASLGGFRPLIHDLHLLWPYHFFWLDKVATHTHQVQMSRVPWQYIIQEQQQQLKSLKLVGGTVADLRLRGSGWRKLDTSWKHTRWWSGGNL